MIGTIIWLTGIPSSGKTTLGNILTERINATMLDGDILRTKYPEHAALGYSPEDRETNVILAAKKAVKIAESGQNVIVALVSPNEKVRQKARELHRGPFVMTHVDCPPQVCAERDPKGNWEKAKQGEIENFTGLDGPYEPPKEPEVHIKTDQQDVGECIDEIMKAYEEKSRVQLYIGRWQPFHKGHQAIINHVLNEKRNVTIGIRNTPRTENDPLTFQERKRMIEGVYAGEPLVSVYPHPFPNVKSINIGRKVGYEIRRIDIEIDVSGTNIRQKINDKDHTWKKDVPQEVAEREPQQAK